MLQHHHPDSKIINYYTKSPVQNAKAFFQTKKRLASKLLTSPFLTLTSLQGNNMGCL